MNTQKQIFEKLAKQKLGAIEDAINEAQYEALSYIDVMQINFKDLANTMAETLDQIQIQIDTLDAYSQELQAEYVDANESFREVNQGLLDNNIEGGQENEDRVKEMTSNFQNMISNVVSLVQVANELGRFQ